MTNDYRLRNDRPDEIKAAILENHAIDLNRHHYAGYSWDALPADRRGLIAVMHDRILDNEKSRDAWHEMACQLAISTRQRVYVVMTSTRWHLMLFGIETDGEDQPALWYDAFENGKYADDQYIAHYDERGDFTLDGLS